LHGDRARGRARRGGGDAAADAHFDDDHGEPHPARRMGSVALGDRRALVDDLDHGAAARGGDDGPLARGTLEEDLDRLAPRGRRPLASLQPRDDTPRGPMARVITLLTDFGTADGYVGEMKGVLASLAPHA